ncbi:unnamed protein product, partial [Brassica oleracea var. botrytis]
KNSQSLIILSDERNVEDEGGFSSLPSPVSSPLGQAHSVLSSPPQLAVGCFRQNIIGVTINGSLGEDALIYSLNVVGVIREMGQSKQELNTATSLSYARTVMQ